MKSWFTVEPIDNDTFAISEYGHWEETHCYLLRGKSRSLLIDTGLGVADISLVTQTLTDLPVLAIPTHVHWDHIGGLSHFPDFFVHAAEADWVDGHFPLPPQAVRAQLNRARLGGKPCDFPAGFSSEEYAVFQGKPAHILQDGDLIDLGGRILQAVHTPGHSPGHLCFFEPDRGYLFTGDLIYGGKLLASFPSTDPEAYLRSALRVAEFPAQRLLPAHHALGIPATMAGDVAAAFSQLKQRGLLMHGSGTHSFSGFQIQL